MFGEEGFVLGEGVEDIDFTFLVFIDVGDEDEASGAIGAGHVDDRPAALEGVFAGLFGEGERFLELVVPAEDLHFRPVVDVLEFGDVCPDGADDVSGLVDEVHYDAVEDEGGGHSLFVGFREVDWGFGGRLGVGIVFCGIIGMILGDAATADGGGFDVCAGGADGGAIALVEGCEGELGVFVVGIGVDGLAEEPGDVFGIGVEGRADLAEEEEGLAALDGGTGGVIAGEFDGVLEVVLGFADEGSGGFDLVGFDEGLGAPPEGLAVFEVELGVHGLFLEGFFDDGDFIGGWGTDFLIEVVGGATWDGKAEEEGEADENWKAGPQVHGP